MADNITVEEAKEQIYKLIKSGQGMKKYKAMDLVKALKELYPNRVEKDVVKDAIKALIAESKLVYTYFGGSFIEIPRVEGSANPEQAD